MSCIHSTADMKYNCLDEMQNISNYCTLKICYVTISFFVDVEIYSQSFCPVAVIVDVSNIWHRTKIDEEVLKALHLHRVKPSILVLNKVRVTRCQSLALSYSTKNYTETVEALILCSLTESLAKG